MNTIYLSKGKYRVHVANGVWRIITPTGEVNQRNTDDDGDPLTPITVAAAMQQSAEDSARYDLIKQRDARGDFGLCECLPLEMF
jgi:hypothetical protein